MKKEEKILINYILYFITFFVICLIGISGVFAETITDMTFSQFRTTVNSYGITSNQSIYDTTSAVPVNMGVSPNGFAFEWITNYTNNCSGQTIINGQMAIPNDNLNYDWLDENIKDIYYAPNINGVDGTACTYSISPSNMIISFTCSTAQPNNNFIIGGHLKYRTNTNFNTYFRIYRTFNITCDNSASAIIDNQSQNTQSIINNNNNNTQNIINNNDENTQKIIDSNKVCDFYDKSNIIDNGHYLSSDGGIYNSQYWGITDYIDISNTTFTILNSISANAYACFYDVNKTRLSCLNFSNLSGEISLPDNAVYVRASINNVSNLPTFKVCQSGQNANNKTSKGILGKLGDVFNVLNPTSDSFFGKKLVELMVNGIKSLFVPDQEEMSNLIDDFKSTMETKLGAIYQVADLLVSVLRSILNPVNSNSCMTFPEIKDPMFDKLLIEQTDYCFDSLRSDFGFVFTLSDMIISIVCTLAFANMLYKKYEGFIGGNASDY